MASMNAAAEPLVGHQEREALFSRLCHRNTIRREIGREPIDVKTAYHRIIHMKAVREFDRLLEPHLTQAFNEVEWPMRPTPRLLLGVRLYRQCVERLCREQNVIDPNTKNPNVLKMIERYAPQHESNVTLLAPIEGQT